nr:phospholipase D-like domain-containing protein [Herbaspirillum sp. ASV7]
MNQVIAFANNDVAQILWKYDAPIPGCLGFAVQRREAAGGDWQALPTWIGFPGQGNPNWTRKDSTIWPVQAFAWRDLTASKGVAYLYRVSPVSGDPTSGAPLTLNTELALTTSEPVTLTPERGVFQSFFNRGILSTQWLAHELPKKADGSPDAGALQDAMARTGDPLRNALAGDIIEGVSLLLRKAQSEGGSCYLALYELQDQELIALLMAAKNLHLILSNTGPDDAENYPVRTSLHGKKDAEIIDRMVPSGHIGHNKFCVYVNAQGTPQAVLLGSTNWTNTGLCAQSNNALVVHDQTLATAYFDYWGRLRDDTQQTASHQGPVLRAANATPGATDVPVDTGRATVWFSPNTPHARARGAQAKATEQLPPDLGQLFALMSAAKKAILFLEFQPGSPSVIEQAARCLEANPALYVRGAATDTKAPGQFATQLTHRGGAGDDVVAATAITQAHADWEKELLKSSDGAHAIIHDKIVVIDPMSEDCVVVTGSHNQGYQASYNNDENLLIVRGHRPLALAYAAHVLDVYGHYRFRYQQQRSGDQAFSALATDDTWQNKYFDAANPASKDAKVWF